MSRLYDRIMRDKLVSAEYKHDLSDAVVIDGNNVERYLRAVVETNKDGVGPKDFPNVAPPFPKFFIEYDFGINLRPRDTIPIGVLFFSIENHEKGIEFGDDLYWCLIALVFCYVQNPLMEVVLGLDLQGQMLIPSDTSRLLKWTGDGVEKQPIIWRPIPDSPLEKKIEKEGFTETAHKFQWFIYPALMAISLMHCKNVELIDEVPPPKLSKRHEEKYGVPMVKYKTLKVHSMRREYANDDRESQPGIPKSLHICRGHFKDYRNGGLFGKLQGIYWWDSHVRGSAKRGVTIKDYDVQAPRE